MFKPKDEAFVDSPILERIHSNLTGEPYRPYGRYNPIPDGTSVKARYGTYYSAANSKIENVSQRVSKEWRGNQMSLFSEHKDANEIINNLYDGKEEIERNQRRYNESGILNITPNTMDEAFYQASAKLLLKMIKDKQQGGGAGNSGQDDQDGEGDSHGGGHADKSKEDRSSLDLTEFIEYIRSKRWWFDIVNENINDLTFDDPQSQKVELVPNEEGEIIDSTDLDISKLSRANSEFYMALAGNKDMFVLDLEQMSMRQHYRKITYKYIELVVIDESGSMGGIHIVKAAAYIYNRLDRVRRGISMCGIVGFSDVAEIKELSHELQETDKPNWLVDTKEKAEWMQDYLVDYYTERFRGGGTNIPAGVLKAYELSQQMEQYNGIKPTVTVITDTDPSINQLDLNRVSGLTINCLAVGNNDSMRHAALSTGGKYYPLEDIDLDIEGKL